MVEKAVGVKLSFRIGILHFMTGQMTFLGACRVTRHVKVLKKKQKKIRFDHIVVWIDIIVQLANYYPHSMIINCVDCSLIGSPQAWPRIWTLCKIWLHDSYCDFITIDICTYVLSPSEQWVSYVVCFPSCSHTPSYEPCEVGKEEREWLPWPSSNQLHSS